MRTRAIAPALLLIASTGVLAAQDAAKSGAPAAAQPAGQTPSFSAQVEQVVVDVVVTDKKGNPIRGLNRDDLVVSEDGAPQAITSFEAITLPDEPVATPAEPPRISINTDPNEQRGRTFVIVFDDTNITPWKANQAKAAVVNFLDKSTRDGDRVSIVSTAGATWWTARMPSGRAKLVDMVKRFDGRLVPDTSTDRMSDSEALRIHVYHDSQTVERVLRRWEQYGVPGVLSRTSGSSSSADTMTQGTVDDPLVTGKASEVYFSATTRIRATLEVLTRVINGLAAAKGRKSVILVSEGFIHDINLEDFKRVSQASRRANAAIYFVNARGLEGMPMEMTAQFGPALPDQDVSFAFSDQLDQVAGSDVVATDSGGFVVRNTNDLNAGVQRIATETQAYYLLGYMPTNTARDGKFRKIQVKLTDGKGLQVRARKGYYAPSDTPQTAGKKGVDPVIQGALDSPWAQDGIPLRMTHYVGEEKSLGKAGVLIATDVDLKGIQFEEKDGRNLADLQFLLVVAHRESGEFFRYDQAVNMKLQPATRERLSKTWYPIVRDFELKPGDYQAKIVVRDTRSGRVGTIMHEFDVPPLDQFRVATPIVGDARQKAANGELGPPIVTARRDFTVGSDVFCQIEVFGAKPDAKDGMPRVIQGYVVKRSDGSVFTSISPSEIRPTSLGSLSRLFGFRLLDAAPGDYDIFMTLQDTLAGKSLEVHEPFRVLPGAPTAGGQQ